MIAQVQAFPTLAKVIGHADWLDDPNFNTPDARLPRLAHVFAEIEKWTMTMSKMEVMATLNPVNVPCGPIISMKELAEEPPLAQDRNHRRSRPSRARQVSDGRQSDQTVGFTCGGSALAASRRAHRRSSPYRRRPEDDEIHAARQQGAI